MIKPYTQLYQEYKERHNGSPKHDFNHFLTVMESWCHHRTHVRPKIEWWHELKRDNF